MVDEQLLSGSNSSSRRRRSGASVGGHMLKFAADLPVVALKGLAAHECSA